MSEQQDRIDLLKGRMVRLETEMERAIEKIAQSISNLKGIIDWHPASGAGVCSDRAVALIPNYSAAIEICCGLVVEKAQQWRNDRDELARLEAAAQQ